MSVENATKNAVKVAIVVGGCGLLGVAWVHERVNYRGDGVFRRVRPAPAREAASKVVKDAEDVMKKVALAVLSPSMGSIPSAYVAPKPVTFQPYESGLLWLGARTPS